MSQQMKMTTLNTAWVRLEAVCRKLWDENSTTAVEAQAVDRVHRIGQTNTVFVYRMVTAGTVEERIQALKASKKDLFDRLVGGLGGDFDLSQHFSSLHSLVQLTSAAEQEPAEPGA